MLRVKIWSTPCRKVWVERIDQDVADVKKDLVLDYIRNRWNPERVCMIRTKSTFKPKGSIRDVGRVLGWPLYKVDDLTALIPPAIHGKELKFDEAIRSEAQLSLPQYAEIIEPARQIEGIVRHRGVHPAGVCISPKPLHEITPYEYDKDGSIICQYDMKEIEKVGLIKLDILGLRNLSIIAEACKKIGISVDDIKMDDPEIYRAINNGLDLTGIFQFEGSTAMGDLLRKIRPESIDDLAVCTALFRPGPLATGMDRQYLKNRMTGEGDSGIKELDKIFGPTHGVCIYQEQLIKICTDIAGFTASEADGCRKIIGNN